MNNQFRPCPVCKNADKSRVKHLGNIEPTFHFVRTKDIPVFELLECPVCHVIYQSPLPSSEILHEMYVDTIQFTSDTYVGERRNSALDYYRNSARNMMDRMNKHAGIKVLEIGSGLSWMCNVVKELDPHSTTIAQDITDECVQICKWVDKYIVGTFEDNFQKFKQLGNYDIISLTHVIEHLNFPVDFLSQLALVLAPGGIIFITAPYKPVDWTSANNDISVWKKWSYNHVPAHLQYFSPASIDVLSGITNLKVLSYDNSHDGGQAFELMLKKK